MLTAAKVLRGAGLLTASRILCHGLAFLRSVILARTLAKADFGLASLFLAFLAVLDFANRLSLNQQVVQSGEGESPRFRDTCHALQCLTGVASAAVLALLAGPLAVWSQVPEGAWAFRLLALAPLLTAFSHADLYIRQRHLEFQPAVASEVIPQLALTAAAWPLASLVPDFRLMLYLELVRVGSTVGMSHLLARTPYRWAWDRRHLAGMLRFGWPLVIGGALMAVSTQGDRVVVSRYGSLETVADYSLACSLVLIPSFLFGHVALGTLLPVLSRSRQDPPRYLRQYRTCLELTAMGSIVFLAVAAAAGGEVLTLLYGGRYSGAAGILAILAVAIALRCLRQVMATALMAAADTSSTLWGNLARMLGLPAAAAAGAFSGGLEWMAGGAIVGELAAVLATLLCFEKGQRAGGVQTILFVLTGGLAFLACSMASGPARYLLAALLLAGLSSLGARLYPASLAFAQRGFRDAVARPVEGEACLR